MYQRPLTYMLRLEDLDDDLVALHKELHIPLDNTLGVTKQVNHEKPDLYQNLTCMMADKEPQSMRKLLKYLEQDYACLGYPARSMDDVRLAEGGAPCVYSEE